MTGASVDAARLCALEDALRDEGLCALGVAALRADDDGADAFRSVVLVGPAPGALWAVFSAAPEASDGRPDPVDRWSLRVGRRIAAERGLRAVFPFGGPPYAPFLRWALASGDFFASPIGPLVHRRHGLWASFRFGVLSPDPAPAANPAPSPCAGCPAPCRAACPVDAFASGFDATACVAHVVSDQGDACREAGCRARAACPVGADAAPELARAALHMRAFTTARQAEAAR